MMLDVSKLDPMVYLKPFLNVIHSEEISGPITGAALSSVDKFLTYGFLRKSTRFIRREPESSDAFGWAGDSPEGSKAMKKIADTVVHCRFEATSLEGDDVVLMKILRVLLACLSCPAGGLLSDDSVFEMLSICFRMSRGRLSELLKKTAERTLMEIVHIVFLVKNVHGKSYLFDQKPTIDQPQSPLPSRAAIEGPTSPQAPTEERKDYINPRGVRFQRIEPGVPAETPTPQDPPKRSAGPLASAPELNELIPKPYGIGCLTKTFKFLVELTEPADENVPESLKQTSLQLINTIVETQSALLERIPALLVLLCNDLCQSLLQSLQTDNLDRLNLIMRLFFNMYISLRVHLKMQFEVFFNNLLLFILHASKFVPFEKQEIVLENLVQFFYQPSFAADLFANYDCHVHCSNMLERYTAFLYKSAYPINGALYSIQLLAFECLQALVETIAARCSPAAVSEVSTKEEVDQLLRQRASKSILEEAATAFNEKPARGIAFMVEKLLLPSEYGHEDIAKFLRSTPGLDKKVMGDYIGKQERDFIKAFVETFDFAEMDYVNAMRFFLTSFVMSGEAQIIDRTVECFAHHWYSLNAENIFSSPDVAYVLCFSIIMLNVDAHNPGVKVKMTEDEYIHRLRGIDDGKDLPQGFLKEVYRSITQHVRGYFLITCSELTPV